MWTQAINSFKPCHFCGYVDPGNKFIYQHNPALSMVAASGNHERTSTTLYAFLSCWSKQWSNLVTRSPQRPTATHGDRRNTRSYPNKQQYMGCRLFHNTFIMYFSLWNCSVAIFFRTVFTIIRKKTLFNSCIVVLHSYYKRQAQKCK